MIELQNKENQRKEWKKSVRNESDSRGSGGFFINVVIRLGSCLIIVWFRSSVGVITFSIRRIVLIIIGVISGVTSAVNPILTEEKPYFDGEVSVDSGSKLPESCGGLSPPKGGPSDGAPIKPEETETTLMVSWILILSHYRLMVVILAN
ncbi:unnamed protein product [Hymenolepis diminuta]|uniref:Uncharacterized protein n=1 Tax=Hymenolepis diminuta TaxID=6216 RepID=A0A0R3SZB5_HYMDI|nr:unnamed protein product [Hymenolepis diminuta]